MYLWITDNGKIKAYCGTYTKVLIVARIEERKERKTIKNIKKHNVT